MIRHKLCGVGAAMITPFTPEGKVDYQALACMIDYVIEGGVDYIVALGTTAETPTLYMPERAVIAMFITNHIAGRVPLVMGCGGNSTSEVLDQLREFDLRGADAILSVTPYYNKPSQEGLYQHFRTVSEHSPLPVILYNIPGRSGVNMTAETTLRLARGMKNVIGIKEASGDIEQMQHILDRRPEGFIVLSGDDGMTLELMRRGGRWGGLFDGRQVIPQAVVDDIRRGGDRAAFTPAGYVTLPGWSYRNMWWVTHNEHGAYMARGIHGQAIYVDPTAEMVIARYASHPLAANANNDPTSLPAYHALARHLMGATR